MRRVGWRTDCASGDGDTEQMKKLPWSTSSLHRKLLFAGFAALAMVSSMPVWQSVQAQDSARALISHEAAAQSHVHGLALEHRGDEKGAFVAFLDAAENGYPPAQRKLGEIYDSGNAAVKRDYEESIRWYQKAREGGEDIPPPASHGNILMAPIRVGP